MLRNYEDLKILVDEAKKEFDLIIHLPEKTNDSATAINLAIEYAVRWLNRYSSDFAGSSFGIVKQEQGILGGNNDNE